MGPASITAAGIASWCAQPQRAMPSGTRPTDPSTGRRLRNALVHSLQLLCSLRRLPLSLPQVAASPLLTTIVQQVGALSLRPLLALRSNPVGVWRQYIKTNGTARRL